MEARFVSAFTSAGINQTRHRILIEVHAGFRILTPFGGEDREIVSTYPVTDTVIRRHGARTVRLYQRLRL